MHRRSFYIVNAITIYRIIISPVLLLLIINNQPEVFKWVLFFSFFTDAIDGFLARQYKIVSAMGSTLDSIGDDLTIGVAVIGILVFRPEFIKQEIVSVALLLSLFIIQVILAFYRYGKISSFHTISAKIATILQALFLILFYLSGPNYLLFYIAVVFTAIDLIEEIILVLMLPRWRTNVKGIYWVIKNKESESSDYWFS